MKAYKKLTHSFEPVYNKNSSILILGTFPSDKSREYGFYYGNIRNRFWRVISTVYGCDIPATIEEKKRFLLKNHIALWDVILSCEIVGSSDASIKNVRAADIGSLLEVCKIERIFANGRTAEKLYNKNIRPLTQIDIIALPSSSPANAAYSEQRLISEWSRTIIN